MQKDALVRPRHPERSCWGCDRYGRAEDLACGNGTIRTPHPRELFGDDWLDWAEDRRLSSGLMEKRRPNRADRI